MQVSRNCDSGIFIQLKLRSDQLISLHTSHDHRCLSKPQWRAEGIFESNSVANKSINYSPYLPIRSFPVIPFWRTGSSKLMKLNRCVDHYLVFYQFHKQSCFMSGNRNATFGLNNLLLVNGKTMSMQRKKICSFLMRLLRYTQNKLFVAAHI